MLCHGPVLRLVPFMMTCAQVRAAVEAAHKAQEAKESSKTKKKTSVVEPSYVYSSPGMI